MEVVEPGFDVRRALDLWLTAAMNPGLRNLDEFARISETSDKSGIMIHFSRPFRPQRFPTSADDGRTTVTASAIAGVSSHKLTKGGGGGGGAVLLPLIFVLFLGAVYLKIQRARCAAKRSAWSEKLDKRMSTISADWKAITPGGARGRAPLPRRLARLRRLLLRPRRLRHPRGAHRRRARRHGREAPPQRGAAAHAPRERRRRRRGRAEAQDARAGARESEPRGELCGRGAPAAEHDGERVFKAESRVPHGVDVWRRGWAWGGAARAGVAEPVKGFCRERVWWERKRKRQHRGPRAERVRQRWRVEQWGARRGGGWGYGAQSVSPTGRVHTINYPSASGHSPTSPYDNSTATFDASYNTFDNSYAQNDQSYFSPPTPTPGASFGYDSAYGATTYAGYEGQEQEEGAFTSPRQTAEPAEIPRRPTRTTATATTSSRRYPRRCSRTPGRRRWGALASFLPSFPPRSFFPPSLARSVASAVSSVFAAATASRSSSFLYSVVLGSPLPRCPIPIPIPSRSFVFVAASRLSSPLSRALVFPSFPPAVFVPSWRFWRRASPSFSIPSLARNASGILLVFPSSSLLYSLVLAVAHPFVLRPHPHLPPLPTPLARPTHSPPSSPPSSPRSLAFPAALRLSFILPRSPFLPHSSFYSCAALVLSSSHRPPLLNSLPRLSPPPSPSPSRSSLSLASAVSPASQESFPPHSPYFTPSSSRPSFPAFLLIPHLSSSARDAPASCSSPLPTLPGSSFHIDIVAPFLHSTLRCHHRLLPLPSLRARRPRRSYFPSFLTAIPVVTAFLPSSIPFLSPFLSSPPSSLAPPSPSPTAASRSSFFPPTTSPFHVRARCPRRGGVVHHSSRSPTGLPHSTSAREAPGAAHHLLSLLPCSLISNLPSSSPASSLPPHCLPLVRVPPSVPYLSVVERTLTSSLLPPDTPAPASPFAMPMSAPTMSPDAMLRAYAATHTDSSSSSSASGSPALSSSPLSTAAKPLALLKHKISSLKGAGSSILKGGISGKGGKPKFVSPLSNSTAGAEVVPTYNGTGMRVLYAQPEEGRDSASVAGSGMIRAGPEARLSR
ncbi:hypothetical protein DFH09DRAFT_1070259 [Mycena vulgaris]|nr:hypothetical protein DFH09DRAFT_1070259 [Mycena vulgaris]